MSTHAAADLDRQQRRFTRATGRLTRFAGSAGALTVLVGFLASWVGVGVICHFPRWWELVITIGLPFITVMMMVALQHSQNHGTLALQLKLDELIRSTDEAENAMITLEDAGTDELEQVQQAFREENTAD